MGITAEDLNPTDASFEFNEKTYELRKFDLRARVWVMSKFSTKEEPNGLLAFSKKVEALEYESILEVVYHLLKNKSSFPTYESFVSSFMLDDDLDYRALIPIYNALTHCIGISEKQVDKIENESLKKQLAAIRASV